ncbi:hypothetical protein Bca4012_083818 [Brassica carinata]
MRRHIGELSESDEGKTNLGEELEAVDPELNLSRGEPNELASLWTGLVTRSRLREQEESLQHLAKNVGTKPGGEIQDKPAYWFNFISVY